MRKIAKAVKIILEAHEYDHSTRKDLVTLIVSKAVAYSLPVPSSPVEQTLAHYTNLHREAVCELVNEINEVMVIDVTAITDLVYRIWKLRYRMVHEANLMGMISLFEAAFSDGGYNLPGKYAEALQERCDAHQMSYLVNEINAAVSDAVGSENAPVAGE